MQGIDLRTAVGIRMTVKVVTGSGVSLTVSIGPSVGIVSGFCEGLVDRDVHGELLGVRAGTVGSVGVLVIVRAGRCVERIVPALVLTCSHVGRIVCSVVDGEVEGDGAVSVVNGLEMLHIVTAGGIDGVVPIVGFAGDI